MFHSKRLSTLHSKSYDEEKPPEIPGNTTKRLLNLAVGQVHFQFNDMWYTQKDGLAMGASLAVILANFWMKEFEPVLRKDIPKIYKPMEDLNGICPECRKKITYQLKNV